MAMDGRLERALPAPQDALAERLEAELHESRAAMRRLEHQLAAVSAEASVLRSTLDKVYASRSWRLTAPIRAAVLWRTRHGPPPPRGRRAIREPGAEKPAELVTEHPCASVIALPLEADAAAAIQLLRARPAGVPFELLLPLPQGAAAPAEGVGIRALAMARASPASMANAAAAAARGKWLALWDPSATPLPGWLGALEEAFHTAEGVGMAGALLLDAGGRIAAAGATLAPDGRLVPRGAGAWPEHPDHAHLTEVPALPPGGVLVPASLWREMGGLREEYEALGPALTDFALRVAQAGLRVVCSPFARLRATRKRAEGWEEAVGRWQLCQRRSGRGLLGALDRAQPSKPRVLFIDHFVPTPDRDSGSADIAAYLRIFCALGYETTLLPVDDLARADGYVEDLRRAGVRVATGGTWRSLAGFLGREEAPFDLALVYRGTLAHVSLLDALRRHSPQARVIFNTVDLHFLRLEREARLSRSPQRLHEAFQMQQQELAAMLRADCTILLSEVEQRVVTGLVPGVRTRVIPIVREVPGRTVPFASRHGVVFIGSFRHRPNVDGIVSFARNVWPLVRARLDTRLTIVGPEPPPEVLALTDSSISVAGHVADLDAILAACRLTVAPLRFGAGLKGKIVSSLAAGVPCVASPLAAEGMRVVDGEHALIAASDEAFAQAVVKLHESPQLWQRLSENGVRLARESYSVASATRRIAALLEELGLPSGRDPAPA